MSDHHNRFTEFPEWCDDMIEFFKDQVQRCEDMERFCGASEITQRRIKHYTAKIKLFEIRKKQYLETGDDGYPNTPEAKELRKIINQTDESYDFLRINKEEQNDKV